MNQKYPYIFKILLAAVFALLAFLIPVVSVRLVLGLVAVIILSFNLRKFTAFFITFTILFFLIPSLLAMFITNIEKPEHFFNDIFGGTVQWGYNMEDRGYEYSYDDALKILRADEEIEFHDNVLIKGNNFNIHFDEDSDVIEIPDELSYEVENGVLNIFYEGNWKNTKANITIGTEELSFEKIEIRSIVLDLRGELFVDELNINSTTTKAYLDITSDFFDFSSTTAKLEGNYDIKKFKASNTTSDYKIDFIGEEFDLNSTNANLKGVYITNSLEIDGVNVSFVGSVEGTEKIVIDSNMSNLDIKYLDSWEGNRTVDINSKIGKAKIGKLAKNDGELIINTDGRYSLERYTFLGF
ncbi:MAG: hypothetical protein ACQESN_11700 [Thermotogota bacterium]